MTTTVLPPAPNWFSAQILRCSRKGHVAYGAKHCVVVLRCDPQEHFTASASESESRPPSPPPRDGGSWRRSSPTPSVVPSPGLSPDQRVAPQASIVTNAFSNKAKVTSLAWSPDSTLLAVASDDGHVVLIKVDDNEEDGSISATCTQMHAVHRDLGKDRHKVNSVSWSTPNPGCVMSGDEIGNIVIWDVLSNTTRYINVGKHNIFVMECHPLYQDVVAFGCRLGLVLVVNVTGTGKIKHRLRYHDEDIQGLSWSPSKYKSVFLDDQRKTGFTASSGKEEEEKGAVEEESLLVVSSRDRTMTIWSSKTGRQLAYMRLPHGGGGGGPKSNKQMSWTTCLWWKRHLVLSSGNHGELMEWNLDKMTKRTADGIYRAEGHAELQVVHRQHARTLYSIHSTGASVQTSGQDRDIVSFHWDTHLLDFHLPAFAAWVYAMVPHPLDPNVVALGAGDSQIRVWKLASQKALFDVNVIWQKLNGAKITALAWHPEKDNILAFGTDEGRVGYLDAFSDRCYPTLCDYQHKGTVYSLSYGPAPVTSSSSNDDVIDDAFGGNDDHHPNHVTGRKVLYSCGDGKVMIHGGASRQKTLNVDDLIKAANPGRLSRSTQPNRTEMAFQSEDCQFMALGSDDGSVEVVSVPGFQIVCVLKAYHKLIQSLAWHPKFVGSSSSPSQFRGWLATCSNEHDVHVWDLSAQQDSFRGRSKEGVSAEGEASLSVVVDTSLEEEKKEGSSSDVTAVTSPSWPILTEPSSVLAGHHQRVIMVNWSPHEDAKLLSVSYDYTAQVWDVATNSPVSNFDGHSERLFCGMWSPIDPNVVFTGGEDSAVFCWKIDAQKRNLPAKKPPPKKLLLKNVKEANKTSAAVATAASSPPTLTSSNNSSSSKPVETTATNSTSSSSSINEALAAMLEAKKQEIIKMESTRNDSSSLEVSSNLSDLGEQLQSKLVINEAVAQADLKTGRRKQKKTRDYFPVSFRKENTTKGMAYDDCERLYEFLYGDDSSSSNSSSSSPQHKLQLQPGNGSNGDCGATAAAAESEKSCLTDRPHMGFFTDKFGMDELIETEVVSLKDHGQEETAAHLRLWSGDLSETIKAAIKKPAKLNDWLVSMAAGVSYSLWKEACTAYAAQLVREDEVVRGASYYLMTHQVLKAITVLRINHFYRAAVAIAKSRFPDDVPLIRELYTAWAFQATSDGSYELAAKCWIAATELSQAASLLAKRPDAPSLRVSSLLALKAGEVDKCRTLAMQCLQLCVKTKDFECMQRLADQVKLPEVCKVWEETKALLTQQQQQQKEDKDDHGADKEDAKPIVEQNSNATEDEHTVKVNNAAIEAEGTNSSPMSSNGVSSSPIQASQVPS